MKWVVVGFALMVGCVAFYIVYLIVSFIFVGNLSELKIALSEEWKKLDKSAEVENISEPTAKPYQEEHEQYASASYSMKLTSDNQLIKPQAEKNSTSREVLALPLDKNQTFLIFIDGVVHTLQENNISDSIFSFKDQGYRILSAFDFSANRKLIFALKNFTTDLFIFDRDKKTVELLIRNVGYSFAGYTPSLRVFSNSKADEQVLVYYSKEDYIYGFGGDVQRPRKSFIRFFDEATPEGRDLAEFSYKAGMIVDVEFAGADLILTGDRNRPSLVKDNKRPQTKWKLSFQR